MDVDSDRVRDVPTQVDPMNAPTDKEGAPGYITHIDVFQRVGDARSAVYLQKRLLYLGHRSDGLVT